MNREATENGFTRPNAWAMRAAAIRLARERAKEDADPSLAYGCVDWFRYDVKSLPQEAETVPPPAGARPGAGRGGATRDH